MTESEAVYSFVLPRAQTDVQIRFSDTDAMGHVSSGSYAAWAEVGRDHFFKAFEQPAKTIPWFVLARLALDFHSEGRYGESFSIDTRCVELGTKSMTLEQRVFAGADAEAARREDARLVCTVEVVMVCFDRKTRSSKPIPSGWQLAPDPASS